MLVPTPGATGCSRSPPAATSGTGSATRAGRGPRASRRSDRPPPRRARAGGPVRRRRAAHAPRSRPRAPPCPAAAGVAWGGGAFGGKLYFGDPRRRPRRALGDPAASTTLRQRRSTGAEALAFGPGGAWGTDALRADANLASLGGGNSAATARAASCGSTPAGTVTHVVQQLPLLLGGVSALAFDTGGAIRRRPVRGRHPERAGAAHHARRRDQRLRHRVRQPRGSYVPRVRPRRRARRRRPRHRQRPGDPHRRRRVVTDARRRARAAGRAARGPDVRAAVAEPGARRRALRFDLVSDADACGSRCSTCAAARVRALASRAARGRPPHRRLGRPRRGGSRLPAGLYFARLRAGGDEAVQRVVLTP